MPCENRSQAILRESYDILVCDRCPIIVSMSVLLKLSTHLCHYPHSHHPSLLHFFTPGSKAKQFQRKAKEFPYEVRLKKLGLWSLEDQHEHIRADLIEVFKIIHGLSTVNFSTFFEYTKHGKTRSTSIKTE